MSACCEQATRAWIAYRRDFDASDCDREAFIAGYLRARADALKAEAGRIEAVERLVSIATKG